MINARIAHVSSDHVCSEKRDDGSLWLNYSGLMYLLAVCVSEWQAAHSCEVSLSL